jgi:hypothetical protein
VQCDASAGRAHSDDRVNAARCAATPVLFGCQHGQQPVRALPHIADALLCLDTLWPEDFEDGRLYGRVRARDPFV